MTVRRLVTKARRATFEDAESFYNGILRLDVAMDRGWVVDFDEEGRASIDPAIAQLHDPATTTPDVSVEVENLEQVVKSLAKAGIPLTQVPTLEPTGLRSLMVRDPFGRLLRVIARV